nr:MAG TPA: hypothetical protein [Bacteriophage sp.]
MANNKLYLTCSIDKVECRKKHTNTKQSIKQIIEHDDE